VTLAACEVAVPGLRVAVEGPPDLVAEVRATRPSRPVGGQANSARFCILPDHARPDRYRLEGAGLAPGPTLRRDEVVARLERAINAAAVDAVGVRYALVHAGAVAHRGAGCLLPAPSGRGKTTLVAALAAAGFAYFSDEVAVLDPSSGALLPFPKPLGIKAGGRRVLRRAYPALAREIPRRRIDGRGLWLLPPPPSAPPPCPVPVRAIVLPRYVPRGRTGLVRVSPSEAFAEALPQLAGSEEHATRNLRALVAAIRGAACYRLTVGRLDSAVRLLESALRAATTCDGTP
jgi:hypothetical protein